MNKKFIIAIVALILIIGGFVIFKNLTPQKDNNASPTKISLALDWFPYAMHAGLYTAKERGYFADEGLDVDIHAPADVATIPQTVAQGRDTFGLSTEPDILLARSEGIPVVSVAAMTQGPLYAIMVLDKSDIKRPRDLKDKRVGHSGLSLERLLLDTVFKHDGLANGINDVKFINVGYDALTGLLAGKIDGASSYYTNQPVIAEVQQSIRLKTFNVADYGVPSYYELVIVTNEDMVKNNYDVVERFLRAASRGYKEAAKNPNGAIELMKRANPEFDTVVGNKEILLETPIWFTSNGTFGWQEESKWLNFAQWMKDGGLLTKPVDTRKAFTNSFIKSLR